MFKEVRFTPGQMLVREGEDENDHFFIIAKGLVRLECMNNPYRKREYNKDGLLSQMTNT